MNVETNNVKINIDKTTNHLENPAIREIENLQIINNFRYNYDDNIDIIDNDMYKLICKDKNSEKEDKLANILLPLFPSDKVFFSEFNSDKIFLLDKFISKSEKKIQKNKEIKDDDENLENLNKKNQMKLYKKARVSSIINKLKEDKSLSFFKLTNMNSLWKNYIKNLLNKTINYDTIFSKMVKADLHGAIIYVCDSLNKNNIGIEGINILETKRTFNLLNKKNEIKTILKKGSIFSLDISFAYDDVENFINNENNNNNQAGTMGNICEQNTDKNPNIKFPIVIQILGDNFMYKSSFRSKAKFKNKYVL